MSEPDENRMDDAVEAGRTGEANSSDSGAAASPAGRDDVEISDLSDTGVGLGAGEPNTFEPEEAAPAADSSTE